MASPARMSQAEYDVWCWTTEERTEYVDGRVIVLTPENRADEDGRWFLGSVLRAFVEERGLGTVHGPNFQIRPRDGLRRVPDLLFLSTEHADRMTDTGLLGAPDLAVEFISPRSRRRDRLEKFAEYQEAGVGEYWMVDKRQRRIEAFGLGEHGTHVPLPCEEGVLRSSVVPGFWIRVEWLWQNPPPRHLAVLGELGLVPPT